MREGAADEAIQLIEWFVYRFAALAKTNPEFAHNLGRKRKVDFPKSQKFERALLLTAAIVREKKFR